MNNKILLLLGILVLFVGGILSFLFVQGGGKLPFDAGVSSCANPADFPCGPITCPDGTTFGSDPCTPAGFGSCGAREAQACAGHQGGGGNTCSGAGNAGACGTVGQVVAYSGGTCICTRTTGTLCACVPSNGSGCVHVNDGCNSVGESCSKGGQYGTCINNGNETVNGVVGIKCSCKVAPVQGSVCGNGSCEQGETNQSCPTDCNSECGNGTCNAGENVNNCPADCTSNGDQQCVSDGQCGSTQYCDLNFRKCLSKKGENGSCSASNQCLNGDCVDGLCAKTCTRRSDCNVGQYCESGTCRAAKANGANCGTADECISRICEGGLCLAQGTGTSGCSFDSDCTNGQICSPTTKTCITPGTNNDCTSNSECAAGYICASNRCRQEVDDSDPNVSCVSGRYYCGPDFGCALGSGKICNNGSISGSTCTVADACAYQVQSGNVSPGGSCVGVTRLSAGESSRGGFVGCNGTQNCFCPHQSGVGVGGIYSGGSVTCFEDIGGDSCGATDNPEPPITGGNQPICSQSCSTSNPCSDGTSCINGVCRNPDCPNDADCSCNTTLPICNQTCNQNNCADGTSCVNGTCQNPSCLNDADCICSIDSTPYCGDSICQAGETCERATAGSSNFRDCTTNILVPECRGIATQPPTPAGVCNYCGDGVVNGPEECDYNSPGSENCDTNCTQTISACISLEENGPDPLRSGEGNVVEYTLTYSQSGTGNPFPSIVLRVGPAGGAVGRDANNTTSALVRPFAVPAANDTGNTKTYKFLWEAAETNGNAVADGTYDVRVLLQGTDSTAISTAACQETITVSSTTTQSTVFTIVKSSAEVCLSNGDARINYTIRVTNTGPVEGTITEVTDTLDSDVVSAGIIPSNINPTYGTYSSGVITWVGSATDRTYTSGQSKTFTYDLTIPAALVPSFTQRGVDNEATVRHENNVSTHEVNTPVSCTIKVPQKKVPETAVFSDPSLYVIFGSLLVVTGIVVYKLNIGKLAVSGLGGISIPTSKSSFEKNALGDIKKKK